MTSVYILCRHTPLQTQVYVNDMFAVYSSKAALEEATPGIKWKWDTEPNSGNVVGWAEGLWVFERPFDLASTSISRKWFDEFVKKDS